MNFSIDQQESSDELEFVSDDSVEDLGCTNEVDNLDLITDIL